MGYKLAGFDVIGCNEIDPKMMAAYRANHSPRFSYLEPIQTFKLRDDLPPELYELDILDGSPPCSSFSMAGNREKDWGKEKKFREGQAEQVLDTLFFDFIDLAKKLQPKVVIAENVKGMLCGDAQKYVSRVLDAFAAAGYYASFKLLDASKMGVPQRRERVFFYAIRRDLYQGAFADLFMTEPILGLGFNERAIPFGEIMQSEDFVFSDIESVKKWKTLPEGECFSDYNPAGTGFACIKVDRKKPMPTIIAKQRKNSMSNLVHPIEPRGLNLMEFSLAGSYPVDYNFCGESSDNNKSYLIGMSVPPVMTAQVATRVWEQWLEPLQ